MGVTQVLAGVFLQDARGSMFTARDTDKSAKAGAGRRDEPKWLCWQGRRKDRLDTKSRLGLHLRYVGASSRERIGAPARLTRENRVVTKKEIVKAISDEIGMTQLKTKEIVQKTFDAIVDTLIQEKRIELRNFGVFEVKKRAARKARNPRTGDKVFVPEKYVVTFKPGKEMEEKVRQLEEAAAKEAIVKQTVTSPTPVESTSP